MITSLKRVIKSGCIAFRRNGLLSIATISIMVLVLLVLSGILVLGVISETIIASLEDKVDISVYFLPTAEETKILEIKNNLADLPDIKDIVYISKDEALARFKDKHKEDEIILKSLEEINDNPLGASLNIKAGKASSYENIARFLEQDNFKQFIDKINFSQHKELIDKIGKIIYGIRRGVLLIGLVLAIIVVLITFNAIRLTIYSLKEEISIMKLVGASNWFVRGPFIVEGVIYAVISFIITIIIFYSSMYFISPYVNNFFGGLNFFNYFVNNAFTFSLVIFVASIALGILSSLLAIRRYLKV